MEKKKRYIKPHTASEQAFLKNLFDLLLKDLRQKPEGLRQFAVECDVEHSNLYRSLRKNPNARIINIKRICECRGKKLWELVKEAEEMKETGE